MVDPRRLFTESQARQIVERQNGRCWKCRAHLQTGFHVHHVIAWGKGGLTEIDNGMALCDGCHLNFNGFEQEAPTKRQQLRDWQKRCKEAFYERLVALERTGEKRIFKIEACVASGKSTMMAEFARELILGDWSEEFGFEFIAIVAPNISIIGAHAGRARESFGIIGALERRGIYAIERITSGGRLPVSWTPQAEQTPAGVVGIAAVFTYQYLRQESVQRQLVDWARSGKKIAVFYDEIHHVPDLGTSWSAGLSRINDATALAAYFSGTWYRTDRRAIFDQFSQGRAEPDFSYNYAEAIGDGVVRPVSFWIPNVTARMKDAEGTVIDERPVDEYIEEIPREVKLAMFDPKGWFVETMIRRASTELAFRRTKYRDAGCLVVCPPGFQDYEKDPSDDVYDESVELTEQNRKAEEIHRRIEEITGKQAMLVLNGHPPERIAEFRESDSEFIVAVNRISEGCDIPRLRVGLILRDLSNTRLQFNQIIGRFIRRRAEDDEEPALVIMPPIQGMCEFARAIAIEEKNVVPKKSDPCPACGRLPCKCPCKRCGMSRPCRCPCFYCGERPCICCDWGPGPEIFVELDGLHDQHIVHGIDVADPYTARMLNIREKKEDVRHIDVGKGGLLLQLDAEVNGAGSPAPQSAAASRLKAVATAANWAQLVDTVPIEILRFSKLFRQHDQPYAVAWNHINRKFFPGTSWKQVRTDPRLLSIEKLTEVIEYARARTNRR